MDRVNWTKWVFEKPLVFKVAISSCVCRLGEGRVVVMVVYVGESVGVLMRFVWRPMGVGRDVLGVGLGVCLEVWVGGGVSFGQVALSVC